MKIQGKKVLGILLLTLIFVLIINITPVNATLEVGGFKAETSNTGNQVQTSANIVIGIIQAIGIAAAIIMLIMVAIKYLSAAPGEKADIKKSIIIYAVGAVLLFAATGILGIIQGFANEIAPATQVVENNPGEVQLDNESFEA